MQLGQYDDDKKYGGYRDDHKKKHGGYDDKKHDDYDPYDHSQIKKTGVYPGSFPEGYRHHKKPGYGGYGHHGSYGGHGGYGGHGSYGGYGGHGGYGYKHYETCYPDYDSYGPQKHRIRYLARSKRDNISLQYLIHKPNFINSTNLLIFFFS